MSDFPATGRNRVVRIPDRGHYDRPTVYAILDAALICHVGLLQDGAPLVIPTLYARDGDDLLLHGASSSRLLRYLAGGGEVSVAVTLVDALVLARSIFHHSVNYRSVVLFGRGQPVAAEAKPALLKRFSDKLIPGRWEHVRAPSPNELKATAIVRVPIELASAKVRSGPAKDDAADMSLQTWAGIVPLQQTYLPPEADAALPAGIPLPDHVRALYESD